jgi:SAM-dependent methyltransferase
MTKFNISKCPVCGSNNFYPFLTCIDFIVSGEKYDIKICSDCGLKITFDIKDEENIGQYYNSDEYIPHSNKSTGLVNTIYHKVRSYMLRRKRKIVEKATSMKKGQIIDVGTGTGYFPSEMKQHGWEVAGTEKSFDARNFARNEFNIEIKKTEDLFNLQNQKFDVITLWHVLEHIHKLNENIATFYRLLKKNGKLIIAVPNNNSFDAFHYKEFWAAYDVPRHIWHFTPKQMKLLGEKHDFTLKQIRSMPFDGFYISILSEKYKKSKIPVIKGFFYGIISWIVSLFNPLKSSSSVYIFSKA